MRPLQPEKALSPILVTEYIEFSKVIDSGITITLEEYGAVYGISVQAVEESENNR